MAIIIGDIHADLRKAEIFLEYKSEIEHVVLGDITDSIKTSITLEDELACLDRLFKSNAVLLWGNHDLAYLENAPWRCNTGHALPSDREIESLCKKSDYLADIYREWGDVFVRDILTEQFVINRDRMKAAYSVDGWLCTHAGVAPGVADFIPESIIASGSVKIAEWLNIEYEREILIPHDQTYDNRRRRYGRGPLFNVGYARGGTDTFGGIFWFDSKREKVDPSPLVGRQLFGHTPVPMPEINANWVNLNATDEGIWVFDTDTGCVVNLLESRE